MVLDILTWGSDKETFFVILDMFLFGIPSSEFS